jgi:mannonate dehydratase
MRVGMRTRDLSPERLRFLRQIGITDILIDPSEMTDAETLNFTGETAPSHDELRATKDTLESYGLRFHAIHSIPISTYDDIMFDRPGKDDQLETLARLVRTLGDIGVPVLGYKWMAVDVQRTNDSKPVRGDANATAFDVNHSDIVPGETTADVTEADLWENYAEFVETIVPVAEEAGVRLAVHPADPPVFETLGGIPSLFRSVDHFERAMELSDGPYHGIKLCLGCFSEMGVNVYDAVRRFVQRDRVGIVHFRDVVGTVPKFHETFVDDERSNYYEYRMLRTLEDAGSRGTLLPDHVPAVEGDELWDPIGDENSMPTPKGGPRARAFTAGYMQGLLKSVTADRNADG